MKNQKINLNSPYYQLLIVNTLYNSYSLECEKKGVRPFNKTNIINLVNIGKVENTLNFLHSNEKIKTDLLNGERLLSLRMCELLVFADSMEYLSDWEIQGLIQ